MSSRIHSLAIACTLIVSLSSVPAFAEDYLITIKDRAFQPKELSIPKDQKVKVTIKNLDAVPAEFESHSLNREKVIAAGGSATLFVGPLKEGKYEFFDEFNEKNTGFIIAK